MNKESIKSATLTVLIVISLFFTWNMGSLQPSYEKLQNQTLFESIPISQETREFYEVIKPQQLFFHTTEKHYSPLKANYLNNLWKEMQGWEFSNVRSQTPTLTKEKFQKLINGKEEAMLELRFYDEIPMATFQSMLEWDAETNVNITFDRIFLSVMKDNEVQQKVYFVSYDKMKIVETYVNNTEARDFVEVLFEKRDQFQQYFSFDTGQGHDIMLPENQVIVDSYQYFTEEIEGEKFKDALFSNPRIVKQEKNRYTDGTRVLNIFPSEQMVKYVNSTGLGSYSIDANILIEQSIAFLNYHGGWTDDYILFDIPENDQVINFMMSIDSIPVINSMLYQRWAQNEIAIYQRPLYQLYQLMSDFPSETSTLMSGRKVVELISNNPQLDETKIKNIYIAYELGSSDNQKTVKVSPVWCIEMKDGTLMKINEDQTGGDENGLE